MAVNTTLTVLVLGKGISARCRRQLHELLHRNRRASPPRPDDEDVLAIRSVYRTARFRRAGGVSPLIGPSGG